MRGPLGVRLSDGTTTAHVTEQTTGLRFTRSAFGGDMNLSATVQVPHGTFANLGPAGSVEVFDRRTGAVVFAGTPDSPGVTTGPAGELFELRAPGGAARLQSIRAALGYIVTDLGGWTRSVNSSKGATTANAERGEGTPTLEVAAAEGKSVPVGWVGEFIFRDFRNAGLQVARVRAPVDSGRTDGDWMLRLLTGTAAGDLATVETFSSSTAEQVLNGARGATGTNSIPVGHTVAAVRAGRLRTSRTATDDDWFRFYDIAVHMALRNLDGTEKTTGYGDNTVTATDVITDMVGRGLCPNLDHNKVTVGAFDYQIDTLDWLDGITMGDALNELQVLEPDLFWMVSGDTATFGSWDHARPRYVISKGDGGITLPGQERTLCNRVLVTWTDRRGRDRTTVVRATVDGLDFTRDAESISLPEGTGSEANAERAGLAVLALTNNPPHAGSAVIRRPILDRWAGCMVLPHEVTPGCVVVEQETGLQYRLTQTEYADADGAVTCQLGEPTRTPAQILARLRRAQRRRRR